MLPAALVLLIAAAIGTSPIITSRGFRTFDWQFNPLLLAVACLAIGGIGIFLVQAARREADLLCLSNDRRGGRSGRGRPHGRTTDGGGFPQMEQPADGEARGAKRATTQRG